jgi:multidrug resistance efflux pump
VLDAQIGNQQVQRQTEVMRLERMLRQFESRVIRLERQLMSVSRLPTITMAEAKAGVDFAEVQLRESEQLHKKGEITEVGLAADRLALARAQGQFDAAEAAHAESLMQLELDVLFAERQLLEQTNESSQLERLVAKGYANSNGLAYRKLDVGLAEKQLLRARLRLESQRKSAGEIDSPDKVE